MHSNGGAKRRIKRRKSREESEGRLKQFERINEFRERERERERKRENGSRGKNERQKDKKRKNKRHHKTKNKKVVKQTSALDPNISLPQPARRLCRTTINFP
jgi:hypothetical protein